MRIDFVVVENIIHHLENDTNVAVDHLKANMSTTALIIFKCCEVSTHRYADTHMSNWK